METDARLFNCVRCHRQVVICSHCDRGNIYCGPGCARSARSGSVRAAGCRYQNSRRGRFSHAARQQRYRQRQKQKVTHQGSPASPPDDSIDARSKRCFSPSEPPEGGGNERIVCHFCGRICSPFLRLRFRWGRSSGHRTPTGSKPVQSGADAAGILPPVSARQRREEGPSSWRSRRNRRRGSCATTMLRSGGSGPLPGSWDYTMAPWIGCCRRRACRRQIECVGHRSSIPLYLSLSRL